jgi:hypothetical protein
LRLQGLKNPSIRQPVRNKKIKRKKKKEKIKYKKLEPGYQSASFQNR